MSLDDHQIRYHTDKITGLQRALKTAHEGQHDLRRQIRDLKDQIDILSSVPAGLMAPEFTPEINIPIKRKYTRRERPPVRSGRSDAELIADLMAKIKGCAS